MDALSFLEKVAKTKRQPVIVLFGDEDFLKRLCRDSLLKTILGDTDPSFAVSSYAGDKLDFGTVRNDLDTLPFIGPVRVVIVENADGFVSEHREALERYVAVPSKVGVLILDVKTFPETTKLAKALPDSAKIACKAPQETQLVDWCRQWTTIRYGKTLSVDAAQLLLELVGPQMGLLDREIAKLAITKHDQINAEAVSLMVVRSRDANVFRILEAIGEGRPAEALAVVADLLADGEDVFMILGALTAQLRKLAAVNRLIARGQALGPAMDAVGVPRWPKARQGAERQLRYLGRRRLNNLSVLLVEVNMGFRGDNPLSPRLQLERLIVGLSRPRE